MSRLQSPPVPDPPQAPRCAQYFHPVTLRPNGETGSSGSMVAIKPSAGYEVKSMGFEPNNFRDWNA